MEKDRQEVARRLYEIAEGQQGTRQAKAAGFAENKHTYHVRVGNRILEHRAISRLANFLPVERPDLMQWS